MPTVITTTGQSDTTNNPTYQYFIQTFSLRGAITGGNTDYLVAGNSSEVTTENTFYITPVACTLCAAYGFMKTGPGAGDTATITVREDGADTACTFTITGAGADKTGSDASNTVDFAMAGRVSVKCVATNVGWAGQDLSVTLLFRRALQ